LPQQLKAEVEPVIASLLSNSGQEEVEANLVETQKSSTGVLTHRPANPPPPSGNEDYLPSTGSSLKPQQVGDDVHLQDTSRLQYEREFLLSFRSDFAQLPEALEACLYPVIVTTT
jgi:hypothetical protein